MPKVEFFSSKGESVDQPPTKVWPIAMRDSIRIMASNPSVSGGEYTLCDISATGIQTYAHIPASLGIALKDGRIIAR